MNKFIIIVSVYDQENTQAYPLGGVFDSHMQADLYLSAHVNEVKEDHWTKGCVDGYDDYEEEFSLGGAFHARDLSNGSALDIEIYAVPVM